MMVALRAQPDIGARSHFVLSMGGVGNAGVGNELFYRENTTMLTQAK
jgi:NAD/NADP transhydrogenase beta subunit